MIKNSFRRKKNNIALPPKLDAIIPSNELSVPDSPKPPNYPNHVNVTPCAHTMIKDVTTQYAIHEKSTRVYVIGLCYECHVFQSVNEAWDFIRNVFQSREIQCTNIDEMTGKGSNRCEPFWIDVQKPTKEDIDSLGKLFDIKNFLADHLKKDLGDRVSMFEDLLHASFVTRVDDGIGGIIGALTQIDFIIHENYCLTIHDQPVHGMEQVLNRIATESTLKTSIQSPDWVLYATLDCIVDLHIPYVDSLQVEVDTLDELVFMLAYSEHDDLLRRIGQAKKRMIAMRRMLHPKTDICSRMIQQHDILKRFMSKPVLVYMRDVLDHLNTCADKLATARENLMHTHSNYITKVQIDISHETSKADEFMNRIVTMSTLLAPCMLITALGGMNIWLPGSGNDGVAWFWGIVSLIFVMTMILMIFVRKGLVNIQGLQTGEVD
jgi:magnesium transporter